MTTQTLTLQQPDQAALSRTADSALALVESFEVVDSATYEIGAEELKAIKAKATSLEEQRKAITAPLDAAKKQVMDLFRNPVELLGKAEAILKGKLLAYQQEEQRKAREAQLAAERAAQEERDRLAAEAAKLVAEGREGEAMVKQAVAEMIVAAPPAVQEPAKVAGLSMRSTLDFELVDFQALIRHVAANPELAALLTVDSVKLRAYVKGLGTACKLPGVRVFEKATLAASRK
jgi:hypothetical protein